MKAARRLPASFWQPTRYSTVSCLWASCFSGTGSTSRIHILPGWGPDAIGLVWGFIDAALPLLLGTMGLYLLSGDK